jgi:hypothetical protein
MAPRHVLTGSDFASGRKAFRFKTGNRKNDFLSASLRIQLSRVWIVVEGGGMFLSLKCAFFFFLMILTQVTVFSLQNWEKMENIDFPIFACTCSFFLYI